MRSIDVGRMPAEQVRMTVCISDVGTWRLEFHLAQTIASVCRLIATRRARAQAGSRLIADTRRRRSTIYSLEQVRPADAREQGSRQRFHQAWATPGNAATPARPTRCPPRQETRSHCRTSRRPSPPPPSPRNSPAHCRFCCCCLVLTLAPSILLMTTCFTRIVIVMSLLRQALGAAQLPPNRFSSAFRCS